VVRLTILSACTLALAAVGLAAGQPAGLFTISGRVVSATGGPLPPTLAVMIYSPTPDGSAGVGAELTAGGRFTASGLGAGRYVVVAGPAADGPGDRPAGERGYATVTIDDGDVRDLVITTAPGVTVRGRIRFDEAQEGSPRPETIVVHAALAAAEWLGPFESAPVAEDGTFALHHVVGPRVFRTGWGAARMRNWWAPGPVLLDGRDITNEPVYAGQEPIGEIVVVFTQRPATIVGRVEDVAGLTMPGACVVLLPENAELQRGWSTAVGTADADRRGRFYFTGMPDGDYFVTAFEAPVCPSRLDVIAQAGDLARGATRVAVRAGTTARVLVTTGTPPSRP
jgi:hypothetical protein